jgi:hypothetical protein
MDRLLQRTKGGYTMKSNYHFSNGYCKVTIGENQKPFEMKGEDFKDLAKQIKQWQDELEIGIMKPIADIKYRAWDTLNNKMYLPPFGANSYIAEEFISQVLKQESFVKNRRFVFSQFIGIKDIEGNDIYEGDLIRVEGLDNDGVYFVKYYLPECFYVLVTPDNMHTINFSNGYQYTIMGNKYELERDAPKDKEERERNG